MKIPMNLVRYAKNGVPQDEIVRLEEELGVKLPSQYRSLLLASDGMSIDGGVLVYGSTELVERNQTLEVKEYTPGYVAIGDSGEGAVFLLKLESSDSSVYVVDAGVMDVEFMTSVGKSVEDWMTQGCPFRQ